MPESETETHFSYSQKETLRILRRQRKGAAQTDRRTDTSTGRRTPTRASKQTLKQRKEKKADAWGTEQKESERKRTRENTHTHAHTSLKFAGGHERRLHSVLFRCTSVFGVTRTSDWLIVYIIFKETDEQWDTHAYLSPVNGAPEDNRSLKTSRHYPW